MAKNSVIKLNQNDLRTKVHSSLLAQFGESILPTTIDQRVDTYWKTFNVIGGLELGNVIEAYGEFSSGKSLLMMICGAAIQKLGGIFFCFNTEAANRDQKWLEKVVPDLKYKDIVFYQPNSIEHVFGCILSIIDMVPVNSAPVFVGIDSLASCASKHELEVGLEKEDLSRAKKISAGLRMAMNPLSKKPMVLFCTSQMRTKITKYGGSSAPTGGKAPEFYASLVVRMNRGKYITKAVGKMDLVLGREGTLEIMKGRYSPAGRKVEFDCYNDTGINPYSGLLDLLLLNEVLIQKGAWIYYGEEKFQRCDFIKFIEKHKELVDKINQITPGIINEGDLERCPRL